MKSDPRRLAEIDALFEAVLDLDPEARSTLLEARCTDPEMRREVEELLAASEAETGLLDRDVGALGSLLGDGAPPPRVGPYKPIRVLGRGGMAVVYLAERVDGHFDQQVALKVVPAGQDRRRVVERFERERQILASLDHPSIARLLDGGVAEDGRPYFAMEHVEGLPIDVHCDRHRLDLEARLRLVAEVSRAVHFAHRQLVLHRDLKPSNILVTSDGRVKLLDFGIATVLEGDGGHTRGLWLTPDYASPEQIRGEPMSTAADIYQLGLLLYQLLTGRLPYAVPSETPSAAERVICEAAPTRPSRLFTGPRHEGEGWTPEAASEARATSPGRLRRRLRGDLDTIILQCLRKEARRRYASAEQLAADLERHLRGLPVSAHPDSLAYRGGKFLRRHHKAVAAGLLLALLGLYHLGVVHERNRVVAAERDKARAEAAKASRIQAFLVELFENADPSRSPGEDLTVRQVLDRGAPRISSAFQDQPDVRSEMLATTGDLYRALGLYDQAETHLEEALAAAPSSLEAPLDYAATLARLARLRRDQGKDVEAEVLYRRALELRRRVQGEEHPDVAFLLDALGKVLIDQRRFEDGGELLERAHQIRRRHHGEESEEVATTLVGLAEVAYLQGDYDVAEATARRVLEIRRRILPRDHPATVAAAANLARVLRRLDRLDEAEVLQREGLESHLRVLGHDHPYTAIAYSNLGQLLHAKGDLDGAVDFFGRALELRRRQLDPGHPMLASNLSDLALVLRDRGELEEAERYLRESIDTFTLGHPWRTVARFNLASVLRRQGRYAEAIEIGREVLRVDLARLGEDHESMAYDHWELGLALEALGELEQAEERLREARRIFLLSLDESHQLVARVDSFLGGVLLAQGRAEEAEALLAPSLERLQERFGDDNPHTSRARESLEAARALTRRGP